MDSNSLRTYALVGARSRLQSLREEVDQILGLFPELGRGRRKATIATRAGTASDAPVRRRKQRKFTAAERKAIGERMRKYWAARRRKNR